MEIRILRIQCMRCEIVGRIGVACRDRNDHMVVVIIVDKVVQDVLISIVIGKAGRAGTE